MQAQKLASVEATMRSPGMMARTSGSGADGGGGGGLGGVPDMGMKDLERQLKRLATDMRLVKVRQGGGRPWGGGGRSRAGSGVRCGGAAI